MRVITTYNTKPIAILVKEKDIPMVKSILKYFREKYKDFKIVKYRTGNIGEDLLVSFKVHTYFYPKMLEKFAYNDIPVIMKNKEELKFINEKKEEKRKKLRTQSWSDLSTDTKIITFEELEKLSKDGKIKEVAKEIKGGVGSKIEIITKAKEILSETIITAIENLKSFAKKSFSKKEAAIHELLLIATDKDLKMYQKKQEMMKAGETAIELALSDQRLFSHLISIANNSKLDNITNIKAAISLSGIVLSVKEDKNIELPDVTKSLNTRWLKIAYETIQQKISSEDRKIFNDLLNFIEERRTAA